jgi:Carboxypeptidase regulatory-like domain
MIRFALVVCALCASSHVSAYSVKSVDDLDHVNFEGAVADSSGNVVAGASVFVRQTGLGAERSTKTNREGRYRFATMSPGVYRPPAMKRSAP